MLISLCILAGVGFFIALYAYIVEIKIRANPNYKAFCDVSDTISCTKPLKSSYGTLFGYSNAVIGMLFYSGIIILALINAQTLIFYAACLACLISVYLGWILFTKIKSACFLCISLYIINLMLLIMSFLQ